jgi:hypothetical protein
MEFYGVNGNVEQQNSPNNSRSMKLVVEWDASFVAPDTDNYSGWKLQNTVLKSKFSYFYNFVGSAMMWQGPIKMANIMTPSITNQSEYKGWCVLARGMMFVTRAKG